MIKFSDDREKYKYARLERHDGILEITLHSD
jgi:hypothetical protein